MSPSRRNGSSGTLHIEGRSLVGGATTVHGSKNIGGHLLAAALLSTQEVRLENLARIPDTDVVCEMYDLLGVRYQWSGDTLSIDPKGLEPVSLPSELCRRFRGTPLIFSAVLARTGRAATGMPGGDAFTIRPIDIHLNALRAMGADIEESESGIRGVGRNLTAATVSASGLYGPSMGGTVSAMMAATGARGLTTIVGASKEPEVVHTGKLLRNMGADIRGLGTGVIRVVGGNDLAGASYRNPSDRIVAGTLIAMCISSRRPLRLLNVKPEELTPGFRLALSDMGVSVAPVGRGLEIRGRGSAPIEIRTGPHPGYPTDLQPQITAALTQVDGSSTISELVYDSRFTHVPLLRKMGAKLRVKDRSITIDGISPLRSAVATASDIRCGAALLVAAVTAIGVSHIDGLHHIDRGYERIESTLRDLGVELERRTG